MENNQNSAAGSGKRRIIWISLGTLALGTVAALGIKKLRNKKKKTSDENENAQGDLVATQVPVQSPAATVPPAAIPAAGVNTAFPLAPGARGETVRKLQQAVIRKYGATALPKYGTDGMFGSELTAALRKAGYNVPLKEEDYSKIVQETPSSKLVPFHPDTIALGLYTAITQKDYALSVTLLKSIGTAANYAKVAAIFKRYFVNGVRQTLVNAMLSVFNTSEQKENTRQIFLGMGLKYNAGTDKWSLSGLEAGRQEEVITTQPCVLYLNGTHRRVAMKVPAGVAIGTKTAVEKGYVFFRLFDGEKNFHVSENTVRLVAKERTLSGKQGRLRIGDPVTTTRQVLASTEAGTYLVVPANLPIGKFLIDTPLGYALVATGLGENLKLKTQHLKKIN
jgi:hypothetical protein